MSGNKQTGAPIKPAVEKKPRTKQNARLPVPPAGLPKQPTTKASNMKAPTTGGVKSAEDELTDIVFKLGLNKHSLYALVEGLESGAGSQYQRYEGLFKAQVFNSNIGGLPEVLALVDKFKERDEGDLERAGGLEEEPEGRPHQPNSSSAAAELEGEPGEPGEPGKHPGQPNSSYAEL